MSETLIGIICSALFSLATLAVALYTVRQKIGVDKFTMLQNELAQTKDDLKSTSEKLERAQDKIQLLEEAEERCQELLRDTRARYEQSLDDANRENVRLMRVALGLPREGGGHEG